MERLAGMGDKKFARQVRALTSCHICFVVYYIAKLDIGHPIKLQCCGSSRGIVRFQ